MDLQFIISIIAIIAGAAGTVKVVASILAGAQYESGDSHAPKGKHAPKVYSPVANMVSDLPENCEELEQWKEEYGEGEESGEECESGNDATDLEDFDDVAELMPKEERQPAPEPQSVIHIPHVVTTHFTGRDDYLDQIHSFLSADPQASSRLGITGPEGVGKTQLVAEYLNYHAEEYRLVWWLRAGDRIGLMSEYNDMARHLGLGMPSGVSIGDIRAAIRSRLSGASGWLLVFDDVEKMSDIVEYLPVGGKVIVIGRNLTGEGLHRFIQIKEFKRSESVDLLLARTAHTDKESAGDIAEVLDDFPFAIVHAAAYVAETHTTFYHYLNELRGAQRELLNRGLTLIGTTGKFAPTLNMALSQLHESYYDASELLAVCGFFAADDIPVAMLREAIKCMPDNCPSALDLAKLEHELDTLSKWALIERTKDAFSLHHLVQAMVRDRLDIEDAQKVCQVALTMIDRLLSSDTGSHDWRTDYRFLRHAYAVALQAERLAVDTDRAAYVFSEVGTSLREWAALSDAQDAFERALSLAQATHGSRHPRVAMYAGNLGSTLAAMGEIERARPYCERALEIDEQMHGDTHPSFAERANLLGWVLMKLGDLAGAKQCFERALRSDEAVYSGNHARVAADYNRLGQVQHALGKTEDAQNSYKKALRIAEITCSIHDYKTAQFMSNLAQTYFDMGDVSQALSWMEKAFEVEEMALGENHPQLAASAIKLGNILKQAGESEEARSYFEKAVVIIEYAFGPTHPSLSAPLNGLAQFAQEVGDLETARKYLERALDIDTISQTANPMSIVDDLQNLGNVLIKLGETDAAKECFETALERLREIAGDYHPNMRILRRQLESLSLAA